MTTRNKSFDATQAAVNELCKNLTPAQRAEIAYTVLADGAYAATTQSDRRAALDHVTYAASRLSRLVAVLTSSIYMLPEEK